MNTIPPSQSAQYVILLDHLLANNELTTLYARDVLGIMNPAARVFELREDGWPVVTNWQTTRDKFGRRHRQAKYVLFLKSLHVVADQID